MFFPSSATKFLTVDELVNVIDMRTAFRVFQDGPQSVREDCGITVS